VAFKSEACNVANYLIKHGLGSERHADRNQLAVRKRATLLENEHRLVETIACFIESNSRQ
jgi:hypothetical protein